MTVSYENDSLSTNVFRMNSKHFLDKTILRKHNPKI